MVMHYMLKEALTFSRERDDNDDDSGTDLEWDLGTVRGPGAVIRLKHNEDDNRRQVQNGEPPNPDLHEVSYISNLTISLVVQCQFHMMLWFQN